MSRTEANELINFGRQWLILKMSNETNEALEFQASLIYDINEYFKNKGLRFSITRGFQWNDPVIRANSNCAYTYRYIVSRAQLDPRKSASKMYFWGKTNSLDLKELEEELQALAIITHLAEVARWFQSSLCNLFIFFYNTANGQDKWTNFFKEFPPALTYAEDRKSTYE